MANQLPPGAPRVPPAKDSLASSYERLSRSHPPRQPQVIYNPFTAEQAPTDRLAVAGWGALLLIGVYIVIQVARGLA